MQTSMSHCRQAKEGLDASCRLHTSQRHVLEVWRSSAWPRPHFFHHCAAADNQAATLHLRGDEGYDRRMKRKPKLISLQIEG